MPFRKDNQNFCFVDKKQASSSHANDWSFHHPTTEDNISYFSLSASPTTHDTNVHEHLTYDLLQFDNFIFPTPEEEQQPLLLPFGWKIAGRKRSIFELETNIHTLSELYSTLIDLRNQLPPQEIQEETGEPPLLTTKRSSSFTTIYATLSRSGSSNFSLSSSSPNDEQDDTYYSLISTYPDFIFESLLDLYSSGCCCCYTHKKLLENHRLGKLNKSYACVIFAYAALHAVLCHASKYGIYSFLNDLASDAYYVAHELLEFDSISIVTIETLVLMSQYLFLMGKEGEARNLFCLAWRHMELLMDTNSSSRLVLWMTDLDWTYSFTKCYTPVIQYHQVKKSMQLFRPTNMEDTALKYKIKGLHIILNNGAVGHLNTWRTQYLQTFLYKRHDVAYNTEDKLALLLHALYFSGMLQLHQQHMMKAFETEQQHAELWSDYFSLSSSTTTLHVEKNLYSCMNAAYGFIQVLKLLLDEKDICQLPHMTDTLSAACTVLYFGNKVVVPSNKTSPLEALRFIVDAFSKSSMMQCPRVDRFVKTWSPLL